MTIFDVSKICLQVTNIYLYKTFINLKLPYIE